MLNLEFSSKFSVYVIFLSLSVFLYDPLSAQESTHQDPQRHQRQKLSSTETQRAADIYKQGILYFQKGQYEQAICALNEALEIDPNSADAHYRRGFVYRQLGQYDKAISDYSKAIEMNPRHPDAYFDRAVAYKDKGEYDSAIADYTRASELTGYQWSYISRGGVYYDKGEYDKAIADFTKALAMKPLADYTYYARGLAYWRKGQYEQAISDLTAALGNSNIIAETHYYRGLVHLDKGEYERALFDLNRSLELNPWNTAANFYKAYAYERTGHIGEAIEAYKAFNQDLPSSMRALIEHATRAEGNIYFIGLYRRFIPNLPSMIPLIEYATKRITELEK